LKYETLQYVNALLCKSGQKLKSGYILAGARFVKMVCFRPELKSGTAVKSMIQQRQSTPFVVMAEPQGKL